MSRRAKRALPKRLRSPSTPPINVVPGLAPLRLTKMIPHNRTENGNAPEDKRINDRCRSAAKGQGANQNRTDQANRVGFENVRGHTSAITHVIANVIGDRRWITWIIFIESVFDLAHQIRSHIRSLGVNTTAESRKNADQTSTQSKADQTLHRGVRTNHIPGDPVKDPN